MRRLTLLLSLLFANAAQAIPVETYVATLERVHGFLAANQLPAARTEAATLSGVQTVEWSGGTFAPDATLLDEVARVTRADRQLLQRLEVTIAELRQSGAVAPARADPLRFRQVEAEQKVEALRAGGKVDTTLDTKAPLLESIGRSIGSMFRWIGEKLGKLLDWLFDLFRRGDGGSEESGRGDLRWFVIGGTVLIALVIVILALEVTRRSKRREAVAVATSEPAGSKRDEDPLSRGATEWERYAAQLAAAGRYREAIRAWYHAVLVTCYSAGVLHFRKGRTNWEYVATVPPSVPWRPELIALTRLFEREWYGHDQSSQELLDDCSERARHILDAVRQRGAA